MTKKRIGLVGARGHTGAEIILLLERHPGLELAFAISRQAAGKRVCDVVEGATSTLSFEDMTPEAMAHRDVDGVILALPNGQAGSWLQALDGANHRAVVVDLSADHRFTDAWTYCIPERDRARARGARRIANPGCYATGAQLGIATLTSACAGTYFVFGVSGYSGAGTTPSPRNDPEKLRDNLMPYSLVDHTHEGEIARHAGASVAFMPHVAPFFRGITLTISAALSDEARARGVTASGLRDDARARFAGEPLVRVVDDIPLVRDAAHRHEVTIGGFAIDAARSRAVVVVTLDNLLKGAATQALQNLNLALGLPELAGIARSDA